MQFKPVPEPPADLSSVAELLEAVPETAGAVDDCCAHLVDETDLEARGEAETWLVFLRALELATAESDGYRRSTERPSVGTAVESDRLRDAFRERVHRADAVLETLERAAEPLSAAAVAEAVGEDRSATGRERRSDRSAPRRRERVRRLLEWAVLLGLAERTADGERYRPGGALD